MIGSNGTPSDTRKTEVPGDYVRILTLPSENITKGTHTLTLKLSNFNPYLTSLSLNSSYLGFLSSIKEIETRESFRLGVLSSLYLVAGLLCFILYVNSGKFSEYKIFGLYCLSAFLLSIRELLMFHYYLNNQYVPYAQIFFYLCFTFKMCTLHHFFTRFLNLKSLWALFLVCVIGAQFSSSWIAEYIGFIYFIFMALYAHIKSHMHAFSILFGLSVYLLLYFFANNGIIQHEYNFGPLALILMVFYLIGSTAKQLEKEKNDSLRKSERLEIELLKKSIQPHFINNTLLSIIHWIKQEPNVAVDMIHSLSEEFDLIISFSKRMKIPITDELELCEKHLFIMSQRNEQMFSLSKEMHVKSFLIPPLILHTLIENSISHISPHITDATLILSATKDIHTICIQLKTPLTRSKSAVVQSGVGYTYIKTRLKETFADKWEFSQTVSDNFWVETIRIPYETHTDH